MRQLPTFFLSFIFTFSLAAQWEVKHVLEENIGIFNIEFYNTSIGIAIGSDNVILKTEDAGETWIPIEFEDQMFGLKFLTADTLIAVGYGTLGVFAESAKIYKSYDGGHTWDIKKHDPDESFYNPTFLDTQIGFVSQDDLILKTENGGESWNPIYNHTEGEFAGISEIQLVNDSTMYGIAYDFGDTTAVIRWDFLKSFDLGVTWTQTVAPDDWIGNLYFLDEMNGYLTSSNQLLKTRDGGMTWESFEYFGLADISFTDFENGYYVAHPGAYIPEYTSTVFAMGKIKEDGLEWNPEDYQLGAHLYAVNFLTDSIGFVGGDYGIIMKTETCGGEIIGPYPWHLFTNSTQEVLEKDLQIYPNPASTEITIQNPFENVHPINLKIISIRGQLLKQLELHSIPTLQLDIMDLTKGMYFIQLQQGIKVANGKVFKF